MNLFGIPLNLLVISVFLSIKRLGVSGALPRYHVRVRVRSGLGVSGALRVATVATLTLTPTPTLPLSRTVPQVRCASPPGRSASPPRPPPRSST
eukprot:scaffold9135_cov63-Phaeocystis_antarctica.AAC.2